MKKGLKKNNLIVIIVMIMSLSYAGCDNDTEVEIIEPKFENTKTYIGTTNMNKQVQLVTATKNDTLYLMSVGMLVTYQRTEEEGGGGGSQSFNVEKPKGIVKFNSGSFEYEAYDVVLKGKLTDNNEIVGTYTYKKYLGSYTTQKQ